MGCLILFLDGVGLGDDDPSRNPLAAATLPTLRRLLDGHALTRLAAQVGQFASGSLLCSLDATLGVPGVPQSGTGQATLWSGVNVAAQLGRHSGPYAPPLARDILQQVNLFKAVQTRFHRGGAAFANAFPPRYLDRLARGTARQSVTSLAAHLGGVPFRGHHELAHGQALSAFVTNEMWESRLGVPGLPTITAQEAGIHLAHLTQAHVLTVFEYFATDMAGHRAEPDMADDVLARLDGMLDGLLAALDPQRDLILVTSDHGNLEDTTLTDHTLNPVPALLWGAGADEIATRLGSLVDVAPAVLHWLALYHRHVEPPEGSKPSGG